MQNSLISNPTVAKLLEADADLAAQEVEVNAQIQSIQQKRHSLKTVIDLFAPVDTLNNTSVATPAPTPVVEEQLQLTVPDVVTPELNSAIADTTAEGPVAPTTGKRQGKKNLTPTSSKQGKKSISTEKPSKNTNDWQQYVKDEFSNASLSEAVSEVMQQHLKQILEMTAIIDAIFTDEIPKQIRSTARERVSNVLSVGAKDGKWYRGQLGKYSMSKAAVENNSST
jgi:NAD(P)-dependent dehydrogenase (short-subunit alcohol dehydrogenase family)